MPNLVPLDAHRRPTLRDHVAYFLSSKARTLGSSSTRTIRSYRHDLNRFLVAFEGFDPSQITKRQIERYLIGLRRSDGMPVAPTTANRHQATLSSFFSWMVDQEAIAKHPMTGLKRIRVQDPDPRALDPDARSKLLLRAEREGLRERALVMLLLATGLRISEALHLDVRDLHLDDLRITVRWGKGGKLRQVYLTPEARSALQSYLASRHACRHDPVFASRRGRLSYQRAAAIIRKIARGLVNADGTPLTWHQTRHSFATEQLGKGMAPTHLARITGHSDLRTLGRYTKAAQDAAAEAEFRRLNR